MQPENKRIADTLTYRDTKLCKRKSASCMHVLSNLGEALAIKLIRATILQAREIPHMTIF